MLVVEQKVPPNNHPLKSHNAFQDNSIITFVTVFIKSAADLKDLNPIHICDAIMSAFFMTQDMTQMQTQKVDSLVLRIFIIIKEQANGSFEGRQRLIVQGRVNQGQNGRQTQGRDRQKGQNQED